MPERFLFVLPALLAAQAALVNWIGLAERPPSVPQLSKVPDRLGSWNKIQDTPIAEDIASTLRADGLLRGPTRTVPKVGARICSWPGFSPKEAAAASRTHRKCACPLPDGRR